MTLRLKEADNAMKIAELKQDISNLKLKVLQSRYDSCRWIKSILNQFNRSHFVLTIKAGFLHRLLL